MKLNRESKLARFYKWSHCWTHHLPDNFCVYFWALVFATIFFPITWLSYPCDCWSLWERIWKGVGILGLFTLLAYFIFLFIEYPYQSLKFSGIVIGVFIGTVSLIFGGGWLLEKLDAREKQSIFSEAWQIIVEKKNAVKESYCPHIDWE